MPKKKALPPVYDNLAKVIQQFVAGKKYQPLTEEELIVRLKLPPNLHSVARTIINNLIRQEVVKVQSGKILIEKEPPDTITGTLRVHSRGFGFVVPDHPALCPQDVFIPKHLIDTAVDGDHVEVTISPDSNSEKGPEGKISAVLKRGRTHLAGTLRGKEPTGTWNVYVPILGTGKVVIATPEPGMEVQIGDRVIMKVVRWGEAEAPTQCQISYLLGHISDPKCDIPAAIEEFDLSNQFSKPALNEAKKWGTKVKAADLKGRLNLTKETIFTIDPETAKDFDDALSLHKDKKGNFHLGVHIADVSYYVKNLSALDQEAAERCNSTYFPGYCLPMLPPVLSDQLCSLRPDVVRLTISVLMTFDKEGSLLEYEIKRSYIKSEKRFTYEEAKEVLDKKKKSPFLNDLKLMVTLCQLLKRKRHERGSIDFSLPDHVVEVDSKGNPTGVRTVEYDITHQLVEEFMLKANEVVAKHLSDQGKPVLYRIHEEPSAENMSDFFDLARSLGFEFPQKPEISDLQKLFDTAKKTPFGQQLSVGFIRSMRLAYYSPDNVGHFGLALDHYCHFTSPIRRYPDLVTHRLLFDDLTGVENFKEIALRCSEQERVSFRAESSVKLLKKLRLLGAAFKNNPDKIYEAGITKVKPFGLYFELGSLNIEGFLHISELENDFFHYNAQTNQLKGQNSGKRHFVGETVSVKLLSVDFILLECKWELIDARRKKNKSKRRI